MARRAVTRGARRRTHWTEIRSASTALSASTSVLLAVAVVGHEGETLARTRGIFSATLEAYTSAGDGFLGAFGMAIVSTAAATAGIGSIPTPLTEAGWDGWFVHRYFDIRGTIVAGSAAGANANLVRLDIDSKAMRKANEDESIVMVVEVIESGTATLTVVAACRVLSMVG